MITYNSDNIAAFFISQYINKSFKMFKCTTFCIFRCKFREI